MLRWFLLLWIVVELGAAFVLPLVLPQGYYLRRYLGDAGQKNLVAFYQGDSEALVYDAAAGWRNKPGYSRGRWQIDEHGGRTTEPIPLERGTKRRAIFLGSSLVNGGTGVTADETISAAVQDSTTEALNFGTMLHALDQSRAAYVDRLRDYRPDLVVVGISGEPLEGITNRFVPFRMRSEVNMPYFKGRPLLNSQGIEYLAVPSPDEALSYLASPGSYGQVVAQDRHSDSFERFVRFEQTPLMNSLAYVWRRASNLFALLRTNDQEMELLVTLIESFDRDVRADGAELVIMVLPSRRIVEPGWRRRLPDLYGAKVDAIQATGVAVLDGRAVLRASGRPGWELYIADAVHYTPQGNAIIGAALRQLIDAEPRETR